MIQERDVARGRKLVRLKALVQGLKMHIFFVRFGLRLVSACCCVHRSFDGVFSYLAC